MDQYEQLRFQTQGVPDALPGMAIPMSNNQSSMHALCHMMFGHIHTAFETAAIMPRLPGLQEALPQRFVNPTACTTNVLWGPKCFTANTTRLCRIARHHTSSSQAASYPRIVAVLVLVSHQSCCPKSLCSRLNFIISRRNSLYRNRPVRCTSSLL
jgi:hypothetical protein